GEVVSRLMDTASTLLSRDLVPALATQGIHLQTWDSLSDEDRRAARSYFRQSVFPVLTPLAVDPVHPFPFLSNLSLSLAVEAIDPDTLERRFARVKVPESLPRFIDVHQLQHDGTTSSPNQYDLLPLEELIGQNLDDLFPGMEIASCFPFRVT